MLDTNAVVQRDVGAQPFDNRIVQQQFFVIEVTRWIFTQKSVYFLQFDINFFNTPILSRSLHVMWPSRRMFKSSHLYFPIE